jgi:multiple sugar transport system ATP-binding protein
MPLEHLAQGLDWRVCVSDALLAAAEQDSPDEDAVARLQQRLGTTTVYVTHDQTEAMTLGDRVAVMRSGRLQQVGTPAELYNRPVNIFVAGFIGSPAMNFMPGELRDGVAETPLGEIHLHEQARARAGSHRGSVIVGVRPESFQDASLVSDDIRDRGVTFKARIDLVESLGAEEYVYFEMEGTQVESEELGELAADSGTTELPSSGEGQVVARLDPESSVRRGQEVDLWVDATKLHFFHPEGGRNLAE